AGAAEAEVVLEADLGPLDLTLAAEASELLVQLEALRETGGAEGMALREQTARRIHHPAPSVGHGVVVNQLPGLALAAEPESLVRDELIRREAIVELDHVDVLGPEPGALVDLFRSGAGQILDD